MDELDGRISMLSATNCPTAGSSRRSAGVSIDSRNLRLIFQKYLDIDTSIIKYSVRPQLYKHLEKLALQSGDFPLLVSIGQRMVEESTHHHHRISMSAALSKRGVELQILGWKEMGQDKKVLLLQRKYDTLLRRNFDPSDPVAALGDDGDDFASTVYPSLETDEWDTERIPRQWVSPLLHEWSLTAHGKEWKEGGDPLWVQIMHLEVMDI